MRKRKTMVIASVVVMTAASSGAQEARGPEDLERLRFMTGCWEGRTDAGTLEERYSPPVPYVMTGMTRYVRDGRVTGFEFMLIAAQEGNVVLTPFPDGNRSEHGFRLVSISEERAVFAAPEHDFPKRILYATAPGDSLVARVDGEEGSDRSSEWRMGRVDCDSDMG